MFKSKESLRLLIFMALVLTVPTDFIYFQF